MVLDGAFVVYVTRIWEKVKIIMKLAKHAQLKHNDVYKNMKKSVSNLKDLLKWLGVHHVSDLNEDYHFLREGPFKQLVYEYLTTNVVPENWNDNFAIFYADLRLNMHDLYEYLLKMMNKTPEKEEAGPVDAAMGE